MFFNLSNHTISYVVKSFCILWLTLANRKSIRPKDYLSSYIHPPVYRIQIERDARLIGQCLYRRTLALRLRQAGQNQFPHDMVCALAPRPQKRATAKLVIDRPHHIAEPRRQATGATPRGNHQDQRPVFQDVGLCKQTLEDRLIRWGGNNSF